MLQGGRSFWSFKRNNYKAQAMITSNSQSSAYHVLLIEDDFIDQESVSRALSCAKEEFFVSMRKCLQEGVDALRQEHFDIILLDLSLPDSYRVDTINRMIEEFGEIPIVVLSGTDDNQLARDAVELGVKDYLVKGETTGIQLSETIVFAIELCRKAMQLIEPSA